MTIRDLWPHSGGEPDLVERYPRVPGLRLNFVASADGAVTVDGKSGGLGGPGDKRIFDTLRMVCDALVVAAGTVRTENYDGLRLDSRARSWRTGHGLPEFPLMVVVSRSLDLNLDQLVFSDAPIRPVVITYPDAPKEKRAAIEEVADVIAESDLAGSLAALRDRGAEVILSEGGPSLFGALTAADLVDELCLTVSPLIAGGSAGRIARGPDGPPRQMELRHVLAEDDFLFLRYAKKI